jgi:hypothetical protein
MQLLQQHSCVVVSSIGLAGGLWFDSRSRRDTDLVVFGSTPESKDVDRRTIGIRSAMAGIDRQWLALIGNGWHRSAMAGIDRQWLASIGNGWDRSAMAGIDRQWLASIGNGWHRSAMAGIDRQWL